MNNRNIDTYYCRIDGYVQIEMKGTVHIVMFQKNNLRKCIRANYYLQLFHDIYMVERNSKINLR